MCQLHILRCQRLSLPRNFSSMSRSHKLMKKVCVLLKDDATLSAAYFPVLQDSSHCALYFSLILVSKMAASCRTTHLGLVTLISQT